MNFDLYVHADPAAVNLFSGFVFIQGPQKAAEAISTLEICDRDNGVLEEFLDPATGYAYLVNEGNMDNIACIPGMSVIYSDLLELAIDYRDWKAFAYVAKYATSKKGIHRVQREAKWLLEKFCESAEKKRNGRNGGMVCR